eukprot:1153612-Pelagomonas_calceolata.AAC.1
MEIKRVMSSSLCLILVMKIERIFLKSVSGASKFITVLDILSMKLQSKFGPYHTHQEEEQAQKFTPSSWPPPRDLRHDCQAHQIFLQALACTPRLRRKPAPEASGIGCCWSTASGEVSAAPEYVQDQAHKGGFRDTAWRCLTIVPMVAA